VVTLPNQKRSLHLGYLIVSAERREIINPYPMQMLISENASFSKHVAFKGKFRGLNIQQ